jgi:DNA-binding MarR family transcriptional regulator
MSTKTDERPLAHIAWPDDPTVPPVRGQLAMLVLAGGGHTLTQIFSRSLAYEDLAGNVPLLILCELSLRGPLRPRELLAPTGLSSGALSKHLDNLERLGMISREFGTVQGDRRGSIVSLTEHGAAAARTIGDAIEENLDVVRAMRDGMSRLLGD